jgi:hypothetical protein
MDFSHKRYLDSFRQMLVFATRKRRAKEKIAELEELFAVLQDDWEEPIMDLIEELKQGPLTGSSLELFGEVLIQYLENERGIYIMVYDTWEGEETPGPVTEEGHNALFSESFENEARAFLEKQLKVTQ